MGFTDLVSDAGLSVLNSYLATRSYIVGYVAASSHLLHCIHRLNPFSHFP